MYKLKLDNVIKVVCSDFEKEKLLKQGYVLIEEEATEEVIEEIEEEVTEEVTEEIKKSSKKGKEKNGTTE